MFYTDIFFSSLLGNGYIQIILSAFFGGLFAGVFSNYFESKRRIADKRRDKYFDHRNTIVQIEHEVLPSRINISRNINSIEDSINNTSESSKRIVLRFFKLKLSPGLSLNLLNLDLINLYSEVYSQYESVNNDIDYLSQIVSSIIDDKKSNKVDDNLIEQYFLFSDYLLKEIKDADNKSLELLSYCKSVIDKKEKVLLDKYLANGEEILYKFNKKLIRKISNKVTKEKTRPNRKGETRPQFITPFLDLKRVFINQIP